MSRRRVRPSTVLLGLSVVLGAVGLLWAADALARWSAENYVERQVQALTGVLERPSVDVHGTLFLPQLLRGRYDRVTVVIADLRSGPLRLERVDAELTGVHVPFRALVGWNTAPAYVEESRQLATLTYEDLDAYLEATGRPVTVEGAADGEVLLTGTVELLGRQISAAARAELGAEAGDLTVAPRSLETGTGLDGASRLLLRQRFSFAVPLDPLPYGQQVAGIEVGDTALTIEAHGSAVIVEP